MDPGAENGAVAARVGQQFCDGLRILLKILHRQAQCCGMGSTEGLRPGEIPQDHGQTGFHGFQSAKRKALVAGGHQIGVCPGKERAHIRLGAEQRDAGMGAGGKSLGAFVQGGRVGSGPSERQCEGVRQRRKQAKGAVEILLRGIAGRHDKRGMSGAG